MRLIVIESRETSQILILQFNGAEAELHQAIWINFLMIAIWMFNGKTATIDGQFDLLCNWWARRLIEYVNYTLIVALKLI